ncbi:LPS export ABC transporter periplasmic protein LptC [Alterisphingorhabdus coralli]|uniref:LPS export ABC transporter periplasmic protein LptC n=1 Tax=Alterisphingorhabdus coralli TaxID=3071408 RepID=A0AA97F8V1_9SPHN|nr:LPS export ABC transporter periplasmic protein LptC [Parasphingorhabdus sp. SCSIO 66989]WOE75177.1 LPS export ABC transporter periplasmic protein LptC [Parasphingorhabdus sp. SCSIO 66989]
MTQRAEQQRSQRQLFAAPGSRHDTIVRLLQRVLPLGIGALVAFLVLAPLVQRSELSFLLDKDTVEIANERMRVTDALYRGKDSKGRPFSLKAGRAVQRSSDVPVVELEDLTARILLASGPGTLDANEGSYDMEAETVRIDGPIRFNAANGYRMITRDVDVDLKERTLQSRGAVSGRTSVGTFRADQLSADLEQRTVTLVGNASMRIEQGQLR